MHTPGPWSNPIPHGLGLEIHSKPAEGPARSIAVILARPVLDESGMRVIDRRLTPEDRANAELIAAAADMLAALELARRYMDVVLGAPTWEGENPYPVIDAAIARARNTDWKAGA